MHDVGDCVERLINLARTIDFDLLHGRVDSIAQVVIESQFLSSLVGDHDTYDTTLAVVQELQKRRGVLEA